MYIWGGGEGGLSLSIRFSKGSCGASTSMSAKEMRGLNVDSCFFEVVSCVWELKIDLGVKLDSCPESAISSCWP